MKTGVYMKGDKEFEELSKCPSNCIVWPEDCPSGCRPLIVPITKLRDEWWLGPEIIGYVISCVCWSPSSSTIIIPSSSSDEPTPTALLTNIPIALFSTPYYRLTNFESH